jgi:hypothetical protein
VAEVKPAGGRGRESGEHACQSASLVAGFPAALFSVDVDSEFFTKMIQTSGPSMRLRWLTVQAMFDGRMFGSALCV